MAAGITLVEPFSSVNAHKATIATAIRRARHRVSPRRRRSAAGAPEPWHRTAEAGLPLSWMRPHDRLHRLDQPRFPHHVGDGRHPVGDVGEPASAEWALSRTSSGELARTCQQAAAIAAASDSVSSPGRTPKPSSGW